jgi:hypothetical protein
MRNFIQAIEHDIHIYAKFGCLAFYVFLLLKTPRIDS